MGAKMEIEIALAAAWLVSGIWFWFSGMIWTGWPDRWHVDSSRQFGWDEALFMYLPVCVIAGPIFWMLRAIYAYRNR